MPPDLPNPVATILGHIDQVDPDGFLYGWCAPAAPPFVPRRVTVLLDGAPAAPSLLCDAPRSDLLEAGIGDGHHGFEIDLPEATRTAGQACRISLRDDATGQLVGPVVSVIWTTGSKPRDPPANLAATRPIGARRLLWLCGAASDEAHRPHLLAAACRSLGHDVNILPALEAHLHPDDVQQADIIVLWRPEVTDELHRLIAAARLDAIPILLDADEPLAKRDAGRCAAWADIGLADTKDHANQLRAAGLPTHVVPTGFDPSELQRSRLAARLANPEPTRRIFCPDPSPHAAIEAGLAPFTWISDPALLATCNVQLIAADAQAERHFIAAALAGVPSIAEVVHEQAGGPLARTLRPGITGFLADDPAEWIGAAARLLADPPLGRRIAQAAYHDVLRLFGPERRQQRMANVLAQTRPGPDAARAFAYALHREAADPPVPHIPSHMMLHHHDAGGQADVTIVVPLHNYAQFVTEALDSAAGQDVGLLDLVIVDDASTDRSIFVADEWARANSARFNRLLVLRNRPNAGLAFTRNAGFAAAETPYVLPLDADNRLLPQCVSRCLAAIERSGAGYAYPRIAQFGDAGRILDAKPYTPARFIGGNFIDAMALVAKSAWASVGGYHHLRLGWEDYEFWCRLAEHGFWGTPVGELLAEYRVHDGSMLRRITNVPDNMAELVADMRTRHPWVDVAGVNAAFRARED